MDTVQQPAAQQISTLPWYECCYARLLIDNHITECDSSFMTRFDPDEYVAMVKHAGVESATGSHESC